MHSKGYWKATKFLGWMLQYEEKDSILASPPKIISKSLKTADLERSTIGRTKLPKKQNFDENHKALELDKVEEQE